MHKFSGQLTTLTKVVKSGQLTTLTKVKVVKSGQLTTLTKVGGMHGKISWFTFFFGWFSKDESTVTGWVVL
jgi:hypothetical protein